MVRERIADDIYVFMSRRYAQVTAGAILTKEGVILIDTLFYPEESQAIKEFLEQRLGLNIRYVINTHYHGDHTGGVEGEKRRVPHPIAQHVQDPGALVVDHPAGKDRHRIVDWTLVDPLVQVPCVSRVSVVGRRALGVLEPERLAVRFLAGDEQPDGATEPTGQPAGRATLLVRGTESR